MTFLSALHKKLTTEQGLQYEILLDVMFTPPCIGIAPTQIPQDIQIFPIRTSSCHLNSRMYLKHSEKETQDLLSAKWSTEIWHQYRRRKNIKKK